jgi:hypothetical protein
MCVRRTIGIGHKRRDKVSHPTTWAETFRDSPRFAAIESVFKFIERADVTIDQIWTKANRVMRDLNAEERDRLPAFVRAALVDREPVRDLGHPSMG